jgi:hypothetical protein
MVSRKLLQLTTIFYLGLLLLTGCSSSFVIKDLNADENYQGKCNVELTFSSANGQVKGSGNMSTDINGYSSAWCEGAKHTYEGKIIYNGYTFDSDVSSPLQFRVDKTGYVYVAGKGSITIPDGTIISLPK